MQKKVNELPDAEDEGYDILEDIQPEDYIFVISPNGHLRGISFPEDLSDDEDVSSPVEDIVAFILENSIDTLPGNATLH